jgi:hypothetical protein
MDCKKYVITNTGNKISTFNYRRCDDGLWEYQETLNPGETKNVFFLEGTFSSPFLDLINITNEGKFPPSNPVIDIDLSAGFYPGSLKGGFSATATSPVDCDVILNFKCFVDVLVGERIVIDSFVTIPKGKKNGFTQIYLDYDYDNLATTTSFTDVAITTSGETTQTFAKGTTTAAVGVITQAAFSACCNSVNTNFIISNVPDTSVVVGKSYYISASTFVGCATYYGTTGGMGTIYPYTPTTIVNSYDNCFSCTTTNICPTPTPTQTNTPTQTKTPTQTPIAVPKLCISYSDIAINGLPTYDNYRTGIITATGIFSGYYYWVLPTTHYTTYLFHNLADETWLWSTSLSYNYSIIDFLQVSNTFLIWAPVTNGLLSRLIPDSAPVSILIILTNSSKCF